MEWREFIRQHEMKTVAVYGLGTETERFLKEYGKDVHVAGLLDGFKETGNLYGYPVIPLQSVTEHGVRMIIVVARPGSCKAIEKRIGNFCRENKIELYDVRGKNLLIKNKLSYHFDSVKGGTRQELLDKIDAAEVVSFNLFDTLIMRKVVSYTDIFELLEEELKNEGIYIPDFARLRLFTEKELSRRMAPTLEEIYEELLRCAGGSFLSASELAQMEWKLDESTMLERTAVCEIFRDTVSSGKKVYITTDSYYRRKQLQSLMERFHLEGFQKLIVSCEYKTAKTKNLFEVLLGCAGTKKILHIGNDETADIEKAALYGMDTFRIYSGEDLYDEVGGFGAEQWVMSLSDKIKKGLFISRMFENPFQFEEAEQKIKVSDAYDVGFLYCAPMMTDFITWLKKKVMEQDIGQILFCARDGYLVGRLYRRADKATKSVYFLSSRIAAIRAGMENEEDIAYVDSMKYSGTEEENLKVRFGIVKGKRDRNSEILHNAEQKRKNYHRYIEKLPIESEVTAMFDFVAKGTTQLYLSKLFRQHLKGFYFLRLEPEFMEGKGLDIEAFYSDSERNSSVIFDNYYILETMLTSPYPSTVGFDDEGNPDYAEETRSREDIDCIARAQRGIDDYFTEYIRLLPENHWKENKRLCEVFLTLVNHTKIVDEQFLSLTIEDSFFGRMTDIRDVIG